MRLIAIVLLAGALAFVAQADASETAYIHAVLNADGSGQMSVNGPTSPPGETWSWEVCDQLGADCAPFATGQAIGAGGAPAGTVFRATASDGPTGASPVWHGDVSALAPPSAEGEVRANALVTPVPAKWKGGWDGDYDVTQLSACANAVGTGCTALTDQNYPGGCPSGAAVIDPAFTGWYLRVADRRYGPETAFPAFALTSPYGAPVWSPDQTTSVGSVGRIAPADGQRASQCGPPPLGQGQGQGEGPGLGSPGTAPPSVAHPSAPACRSQLASLPCEPSATVRFSRRGAIRIHCRRTCRVVIRAHLRSHHVRLDRTVDAGTTVTVRLLPELQRLGLGRATLVVDVDGVKVLGRAMKVA